MPLANVKQYVNLVLGYAYYNLSVVGTLSPSTNWKHVNATTPDGRLRKKIVIPVQHQPHNDAFCVDCGMSAKSHPVKPTDGFSPECNRAPETIGQYVPDYGMVREDFNKDGIPYRSYAGNGTKDEPEDRWLELEADWEVIPEGWRDTNPDEFTHAIAWSHFDPSSGLTYKDEHYFPDSGDLDTSKQTRNAYVEGFDSFTVQSLVDMNLTELHQNHLLNIFTDKQTGDLRVGGIRLVHNVDGTISARCVNGSCTGVLTINPDIATRQDMEDFTYAVISHGNNHSHRWFRTKVEGTKSKITWVMSELARNSDGTPAVNKRGRHYFQNRVEVLFDCSENKRLTFYKVHRPNCVLSACDPEVPYCGTTHDQPTKALTPDEEILFIKQHNNICSDPNCQCDEALSSAYDRVLAS